MSTTHLRVGFVRDEDGVHEHVLGQVSLSLQGPQERVVVPSGEDGSGGDIVILSARLTSCSGHVGRNSRVRRCLSSVDWSRRPVERRRTQHSTSRPTAAR